MEEKGGEMISLRKEGNKKREGYFRSYRAIGEYLSKHGEEGIYWARPQNITSIAGLREIKVKPYTREEDGERDATIHIENYGYY